jgi:hypothetical protein
MTLVLLSLLPVLGATGYALSVMVAKSTKRMNTAYAGECAERLAAGCNRLHFRRR